MGDITRCLARAMLSMAALLMPALAQEPPKGPPKAPPGTVCITPKGWCPAVKAGPPGAACACKTAGGWVQGRLNK